MVNQIIKISKNVYNLPFNEKLKKDIIAAPFHYENIRLKNAVDFALSIGTPVLSALDGIVYDIKDCYGSGGQDFKYLDKANFIIIKHDFGEYSCYVHLTKNCLVNLGEEVKQGQPIGYSGLSGYSSYPHMHFEVINILDDKFSKTIPIRFDLEGRIQILKSPKSNLL